MKGLLGFLLVVVVLVVMMAAITGNLPTDAGDAASEISDDLQEEAIKLVNELDELTRSSEGLLSVDQHQ